MGKRKPKAVGDKPATELVRICNEYGLSMQQRKGIESILESTIGETKESIAERAGITAKTLWMWHKQKPFLDALADSADIIIQGEWPHILKAIADKAKKGDVNCAKWLGEITQRYQSLSTVKHTGKIETEHTGEIGLGGLEKEEVAEAISIIRQLQTPRGRTALTN